MTGFGTTSAGAQVDAVEISSPGLFARILTFGAALQDVRFAGKDHPLTLGSPDIAAYEGPFLSFGTVMGPLVNRVRNAQAPLDGAMLSWPANIAGGHLLHSGAGVQSRVWQVENQTAQSVLLGLRLDHMEDGLPGVRHLTARYSIAATCLRLEIRMETDRPSLASLANHSYWSLDPTPGFEGQKLQVAAEEYTVLDAALVATGALAPVSGTDFDFRAPRTLTQADQLDINLCTANAPKALRPVAWLQGRSGLRMEMASTAPGLQVYDGKSIEGTYPGHGGVPYAARAGLALEAQHWPDAANNPGFPSIRITPDTPFEQVTEWRFEDTC